MISAVRRILKPVRFVDVARSLAEGLAVDKVSLVEAEHKSVFQQRHYLDATSTKTGMVNARRSTLSPLMLQLQMKTRIFHFYMRIGLVRLNIQFSRQKYTDSNKVDTDSSKIDTDSSKVDTDPSKSK